MPYTRSDTLAEIDRILKRAEGSIRDLGEVKDTLERLEKTRDPKLARDGLLGLWERVRGAIGGPELVMPGPKWTEIECERCGNKSGFMNDDPTQECLMCRALRAEKKLAPGPEDGWWAEVLAKGEIVAKDSWCRPLAFSAMPLAFSAMIQKGDEPVSILRRSQVPFRGRYLVVDPETTDGCLIDVKVGNRFQLPDVNPLPLSVFNPKNWASLEAMREAQNFLLDSANVAQDINVIVAMRQPGPFRAVLWGMIATTPDEVVKMERCMACGFLNAQCRCNREPFKQR